MIYQACFVGNLSMVLGHSVRNTREDLIWIVQGFLPPAIIEHPFIHIRYSMKFVQVRNHLFQSRMRKLRS
jgi:hypothetical protein